MRYLITIIALCVAMTLGSGLSRAETAVLGKTDGTEIVTVRIGAASSSKQALPIFPGISGKTVGAKAISMLRVVIPPGRSAKAHVHRGYETAVYIIAGRVETRYGEGLKKSVINVAGDFLFIPADVPHKPYNLSKTDQAIAIVARTDPNEQESVVLYPESD